MPRVRCECKRVLSYRAELAGKVVKCPGCSAKIRLPEAAPTAPPAPDEAQELQLERNEAEVPLAASVPTSDGAAPSGFPLPPSEPLTNLSVRRSIAATRGRSTATQDYWGALPGAFAFPLTGDGLIALIVGVLFLTAAQYVVLLVSFSFTGLILAIGVCAFSTGYFGGYLMTIIERTAHGEQDAPGWPDVTDWEENALKPFGCILVLGILGLGPYLAYRYFAHEPNMTIAYAILGAGLFYMPMGWLCVALVNDYAGLNPIPVFRAIRSVPGRYVIAWALVAFVVAARIQGRDLFAQLPVPILGAVLRETISCYFLFVAARILGLLYYKSGPQLDRLAG